MVSERNVSNALTPVIGLRRWNWKELISKQSGWILQTISQYLISYKNCILTTYNETGGHSVGLVERNGWVAPINACIYPIYRLALSSDFANIWAENVDFDIPHKCHCIFFITGTSVDGKSLDTPYTWGPWRSQEDDRYLPSQFSSLALRVVTSSTFTALRSESHHG